MAERKSVYIEIVQQKPPERSSLLILSMKPLLQSINSLCLLPSKVSIIDKKSINYLFFINLSKEPLIFALQDIEHRKAIRINGHQQSINQLKLQKSEVAG